MPNVQSPNLFELCRGEKTAARKVTLLEYYIGKTITYWGNGLAAC